jgi:hypothetical protein
MVQTFSTVLKSSAEVIPFEPTPSAKQGELWRQPRLIPIHYPTKISDIRDRDSWMKAMMLDQRLRERTRLILSRLVLHLNLKTGRCDPSEELLGIEVSLPGTPDVVKRIVRRSLAEAAKVGWLRRIHRHGGNAKNQSQTNQYLLSVPDDATSGLWSPVARRNERTNWHGRADSEATDERTLQSEARGLWSPPEQKREQRNKNSESRTVNLSSDSGSSWEFDEGSEEKEEKQASKPSEDLSASDSSACSVLRAPHPRCARPPLPDGILARKIKRPLSDTARLLPMGGRHERAAAGLAEDPIYRAQYPEFAGRA